MSKYHEYPITKVTLYTADFLLPRILFICPSSLLTDLGLNNKFIGEVSNLPAFVNGTLVETCEDIKRWLFSCPCP